MAVGFDDNADGTLQTEEAEYQLSVYVLKITLDAPTFAGGAAAPEALEDTALRYRLKVEGSPSSLITYTEHSTDGAGATYGGEFVDDGDWSRFGVTKKVADGDTDHHYTASTYFSFTLGGRAFATRTVSVEVYELWIEYFREPIRGQTPFWPQVDGELRIEAQHHAGDADIAAGVR